MHTWESFDRSTPNGFKGGGAQAKDDAKMEVKPTPLWGASDLLDPVEALSMKVDDLNQKLDRLLALQQSFRPHAHTSHT